MKMNKKYWWIIIGVLIFCFLFYWVELRPVLIRKNCSWITYTTAPVPAFAGITQEQADEMNKQSSQNTAPSTNSIFKLFSYKTVPEPPRPAEPARVVKRDATPSEYDTCLRHSGL